MKRILALIVLAFLGGCATPVYQMGDNPSIAPSPGEKILAGEIHINNLGPSNFNQVCFSKPDAAQPFRCGIIRNVPDTCAWCDKPTDYKNNEGVVIISLPPGPNELRMIKTTGEEFYFRGMVLNIDEKTDVTNFGKSMLEVNRNNGEVAVSIKSNMKDSKALNRYRELSKSSPSVAETTLHVDPSRYQFQHGTITYRSVPVMVPMYIYVPR